MILERIFRNGFHCCQIHSKSCSGTNQTRTSYMHVFYSEENVIYCMQIFNDKLMRQVTLINNTNDLVIVFFYPNGPVVFARYFHVILYRNEIISFVSNQL